MSTTVETAAVPGYKPEVLPIYGCATHCELFPQICWLMTGRGDRLRQMLSKNCNCEDCLGMKPHVHWERFDKADRMCKPRVFSGHMGEIADLSGEEIEIIQARIRRNPKHLYQPLTHRPMDFYSKYPIWPKSVWCMGTFTQGEIAFPAELECGMRVAYVEPMLGECYFIDSILSPREYTQWLVIGLLNHARYAKLGISLEQLAGWIKPLMSDAHALGIPIFMKSKDDARWSQMGIKVIQEWPIYP